MSISISEFQRLFPKQAADLNLTVNKSIMARNGKYNAVKTQIDGIIFDSKKEAEYYEKLLILKQAGEVVDIKLQPEFELQEGYVKDGAKIHPIKYIADFLVVYKDRHIEIIDTKGYRKDKVYLLKKKLFHYKFKSLTIKEV
jgi:hypothetical protein